MSARDRLAAKARRRDVVTVQVTDPAEDSRRAAEAQQLLAQARITPGFDAAALAELEQAVTDAQAALAEHFEQVEFVALDPADFEALVAAHTTEAGDVDRDALRPVLAAACAVDEDLQDATWWAEQLSSGVWTSGERDELYYRLFTLLHYSVPSGGVSKG